MEEERDSFLERIRSEEALRLGREIGQATYPRQIPPIVTFGAAVAGLIVGPTTSFRFERM